MIKLDEKYYLTADNNNWILNFRERYKNDKGETKIKEDKWYCSTLKGCLKKYYNEATKRAKNVVELGFILKRLEDRIEVLQNTLEK